MTEKKTRTKTLTEDEIRSLLEEGRLVRQELEQRIERMHKFTCTCAQKQGCSIHDKAK